jgi:ADP-dependent NAD(P)H-hydrate dehydratase / NAD(P)H-hydrate epimerase
LIHAMAGDQAAQQGERGMCASDVIAKLRGLVNPSGKSGCLQL